MKQTQRLQSQKMLLIKLLLQLQLFKPKLRPFKMLLLKSNKKLFFLNPKVIPHVVYSGGKKEFLKIRSVLCQPVCGKKSPNKIVFGVIF
jgi:hypothetical protein